MTQRLMPLLLAVLLAGTAGAKTPPPEEAEEASSEQPAEPAAEEAEEAEEDEAPLPDIDIWSEDAADEDDVFIPTERISADSNIAYPADI